MGCSWCCGGGVAAHALARAWGPWRSYHGQQLTQEEVDKFRCVVGRGLWRAGGVFGRGLVLVGKDGRGSLGRQLPTCNGEHTVDLGPIRAPPPAPPCACPHHVRPPPLISIPPLQPLLLPHCSRARQRRVHPSCTQHPSIPPSSSPTAVHSRSPYFYHIAAAPGSGEYALRHLLEPGAWARSPLHKRLLELQVGRAPQRRMHAAHRVPSCAAGAAQRRVALI